MTELIELILSKPLEFLAGLGISATTIFSIWKFLAWIISLFTKSKRLKRDKETQVAIAAAVVKAFGGIDKFIDKIVEKVVISISQSEFSKILKDKLEEIKESSNCSVELRAYIQTMLTQDNCEELKLIYEQVKENLILQAENKTKQITEVDEVLLSEEVDTAEDRQNIQEFKQNVQTLEYLEDEEGDTDYA